MADARRKSSIVVIGAGSIGLCSAWALARQGHTVTVVDARTAGSGASRGNAGWITPSLSTPLAAPGMLVTGLRSAFSRDGALVIRPGVDVDRMRWMAEFAVQSRRPNFRHGVAALHELSRRTLAGFDQMQADGVEFEMHSQGLLALAHSPEGLHWFDMGFEELEKLGFEGNPQWLTGAQARELEPAVSEQVEAAILCDVDRHVDPASFTAGLTASLRAGGVEVLEGRPVRSIRRAGRDWVVDADGMDLPCEQLVVAAGMGTLRLLKPLGVHLLMLGAKGYSADVQAAPQLSRSLYLCESKIGVTPLDACTRVGGYFEIGARSTAPDRKRALQLLADTGQYVAGFPTDLDMHDEGWAGLRPSTPDCLPFIGSHPRIPGIIVATGHNMLGITLGPATGLAVAELAGGAMPGWLDAFRPDR